MGALQGGCARARRPDERNPGGAMDSTLPLYSATIDRAAFHAEFPLPDVFERTHFRWSRDEIRAHQERRFRHVIARAWDNPFHRRRWRAAGLEPGDIRSLDDLRKVPAYTSDDVKADQEENPPFGLLQNHALRDMARVPLKLQTSGGTTGSPRVTLYGPQEWELNGLLEARGMYLAGARPGDICQVPSTNALANLGWCVYKACHEYLGVLALTTGSGVVTPSRKQLELAFAWGTNIWISFPEYLTHLAKVARDELGRDVRELNTKFIGSFLGPDLDNSLRRHLEELWGCPVYDTYGTNELSTAGFECSARDGLHFMEDCIFVEIEDIDSGEPVPDGEAGNIVVTALHRDLPPIVRYNLRDVGRIISRQRCACGSCFTRMDRLLGRSDDMVKLRGVNVFPMACLSTVRSDARTTGEWVCVVDRSVADGVIRDSMTVRIEVRRDAGNMDGLRETLAARLKDDLGVAVDVELVPEGSLGEAANLGREGKARRLIDRRHGK